MQTDLQFKQVLTTYKSAVGQYQCALVQIGGNQSLIPNEEGISHDPIVLEIGIAGGLIGRAGGSPANDTFVSSARSSRNGDATILQRKSAPFGRQKPQGNRQIVLHVRTKRASLQVQLATANRNKGTIVACAPWYSAG